MKPLRFIKNKPHITENQQQACQQYIKHKFVLKVKLKGELKKEKHLYIMIATLSIHTWE